MEMRIRISTLRSKVHRGLAAGLLALGASACTTGPQPALVPASQPATAASTHAASGPLQPPAVTPSPASVPGRLKLALVSGWLWMDGKYIGRLERLDYVQLFTRLRDRRASAGDSVDANTLELEVDASTDWRNAQYLLGLCNEYDRVELVTRTGRFSLHIDPRARRATAARADASRTLVFVRSDSIAVWTGERVSYAATVATEPAPQQLLEVPRDDALEEFDAALRRACSDGVRCARLSLYFEEALHGRELVRLLQSLARAPAGVTTPVIRLALATPPPVGEEATAFVERDPDAGRLPLIVIRQVVRASYGFFLACFEGGLARHPRLAGESTVRFAIDDDGAVSHVVDAGGDLPDEDVTQCLIQGFRALRFPAPSGGSMTVQYPIVLRPH